MAIGFVVTANVLLAGQYVPLATRSPKLLATHPFLSFRPHCNCPRFWRLINKVLEVARNFVDT